MELSYYGNYDEKYPNIIWDLISYFDTQNDIQPMEKSVGDFCRRHTKTKEGPIEPNPLIVARICDRMSECNFLLKTNNDLGLGIGNNYILNISKPADSLTDYLIYFYNSRVYGFEYIYKVNKKIVIPLVSCNDSGDYTMGTGFLYRNGIVTALHCIKDVKSLSIKGFTADQLNKSKIYISENEQVDLAFIETNTELPFPFLFSESGKIMQEVVVMGYPKIPAFLDFLSVEKATISSISEKRLTPTRGTIAAYGQEYLSKMEAMLITARIRGGNSGGPIINSNGSLVGIACHLPNYEGDIGEYDDMGYGIAIPAHLLDEIVEKKSKCYEVPKDFFEDFEG